MKLSSLIASAELDGRARILKDAAGNAASVVSPGADPEIQRITDDSRGVDGVTLFAATPQALPYLSRLLAGDRPIAAVLAPAESRHQPPLESVLRSNRPTPILFSEDVPATLGRLASALYAHPSRELRVVGVTGTNGKTTVTRMLYQIWRGLGEPAGVIGTLGALWHGADASDAAREVQTGYTTPRAPQLQELLRRMFDDGVRNVALEVSSEALALGRLAGTRFAAAGFTNLSVDHLDFHGDLESYYQAKRLLFALTAADGGDLVIATANEHGARLAAEFARHPGRRVLEAPFIDRLPAPTRFNQWNASLACLLAEALPTGGARTADRPPAQRAKILELLAGHAGIPGRFFRVSAGPGDDAKLYGIVDYAHTPDALENLLGETRSLGARTVVCVFGCGGDRDRGKRPLMGAIAARLADLTIVCDDNPRSENPEAIRAEILRGARASADDPVSPSTFNDSIFEIGDRRQAIRKGVALAADGQSPAVVVVAGKGHESYQIFADGRIDFSDVAELEAAFADRSPAETKSPEVANPDDATRPIGRNNPDQNKERRRE
ncbi:MAG: UDP-N-acetylmuramoyl-L-alanyl-D-glutamate--2,6-diaminopimelate ligase [Leptospirales bacterium]